jgi:signal peptidase II
MFDRLRTILIITAIIVGLDQASKYAAWTFLQGTRGRIFLNGMFRLSYHENPGAFMSLGATLPAWLRTLIFTGLVSLFLIYLLYFLLSDKKLSGRAVAFGSMMFAGGVGNLIDRIFYEGGVIDFLNVGIGNLRTGIFNVADMAIMAGVVGFFIFGRPKPAEADPNEIEAEIDVEVEAETEAETEVLTDPDPTD